MSEFLLTQDLHCASFVECSRSLRLRVGTIAREHKTGGTLRAIFRHQRQLARCVLLLARSLEATSLRHLDSCRVSRLAAQNVGTPDSLAANPCAPLQTTQGRDRIGNANKRGCLSRSVLALSPVDHEPPTNPIYPSQALRNAIF